MSSLSPDPIRSIRLEHRSSKLAVIWGLENHETYYNHFVRRHPRKSSTWKGVGQSRRKDSSKMAVIWGEIYIPQPIWRASPRAFRRNGKSPRRHNICRSSSKWLWYEDIDIVTSHLDEFARPSSTICGKIEILKSVLIKAGCDSLQCLYDRPALMPPNVRKIARRSPARYVFLTMLSFRRCTASFEGASAVFDDPAAAFDDPAANGMKDKVVRCAVTSHYPCLSCG